LQNSTDNLQKSRRRVCAIYCNRIALSQYEFTLRDLFALPDLPLREMLPEDGRVDGDDKSGDGLELSHVQMSRYLEAADLALTAATASQIVSRRRDITATWFDRTRWARRVGRTRRRG
jgi:hypothetical protein